MWLPGCASAPAPIERPDNRPAGDVARFLLPPVDSYPDDLIPSRRAELLRAHGALLERGETEVARSAAEALLAQDPGLIGAHVLIAQADFVEGSLNEAFRRLIGRLESYPRYRPGQLLLGRAAELSGDLVEAYAAYRRIESDPAASDRLRRIESQALRALRRDIDRAVESGELERAESSLSRLITWSPQDLATYESQRRVAVAADDPQRELEAVRLIDPASGGDRELMVRQATLEMEVGDPEAAVNLYEGLNRAHPNEPELVEGLAAAKFRWRLQMLPEEVASMLTRSEGETLTRADFAGLLYWVVPGLRSGRTDGGRIVSDILGHPQRNAVVRLVNLGILDVADDTLHQFAPDRSIMRGSALAGLLNSARYLGVRPSCLRDFLTSSSANTTVVCEAAARCGLIEAESQCSPNQVLTSADASEAIRRTLELLDAR